MTKEFMNENENKELIKFLIKLSTNDLKEKDLNEYFTLLENIYGDEGKKRHLYSSIFSVLYSIYIDKEKRLYLDKIKINIEYIYNSIDKIPNQEICPCVIKLYDHINLDIARLEAIEAIDFKTENNKKDFIKQLENKELELKQLIEKYDEKLNNLDKELNNKVDELKQLDKEYDEKLNSIDQNLNNKANKLENLITKYVEKFDTVEIEAMKKLTMFLSVFTLIAGNISIIFKGIYIKPKQLVALIFIINPTLILAIHTLFNLATKEKYRKGILFFCIISILIGLSILVFSDIIFLIMLFCLK